jgi:hypothetical protein
MLISREYLKSPEVKKVNRIGLDTVAESESIPTYTLNLLREGNEELRNLQSKLLGDTVVNEGLLFRSQTRPFDFAAFIEKVFDTFIKIISMLFKKFMAALVSIFRPEIQIAAYGNTLRNFDKELKIDSPLYTYTYSDTLTEAKTLSDKFTEDYQELDENLKLIDSQAPSTSKEFMINKVKELVEKEQVTDIYYDNIRRMVFAKGSKYTGADQFLRSIANKGVSEDNYNNYLFKAMRDGEDSEQEVVDIVTPVQVQDAYRFYQNYKNLESSVKKDNDIIKSNASKVKSQIKKLDVKSIANKCGNTPDITSTLNNLLITKCAQISKTCDIFVLAYGAKLTAVRDNSRQNIFILLSAIKQSIIYPEGRIDK